MSRSCLPLTIFTSYSPSRIIPAGHFLCFDYPHPPSPAPPRFASRNADKELVKKLYNPSLKAWFGDKGDGVHTGDATDPRMAVIEVKVDEIRHFHQVKTKIGTAVDVVASAITGNTAQPGEVRTITGEEIAAAWAKGELKEP